MFLTSACDAPSLKRPILARVYLYQLPKESCRGASKLLLSLLRVLDTARHLWSGQMTTLVIYDPICLVDNLTFFFVEMLLWMASFRHDTSMLRQDQTQCMS